jgi:hypothetical protein
VNSWPHATGPNDAGRFVDVRRGIASDFLLDTLPSELLVQVLLEVDLPSLSRLMRASRSAYRLIHTIMDTISLEHIQHGDLRWIVPVNTVPGETCRALESIRTWNPDFAGSTIEEWLQYTDFPWFAFVKLCLSVDMDSMRNRERLWRICEQIRPWFDEVLGRDAPSWCV